MTSRLFYAGPGLEELKEQYAKRGRLDRQAAIVTARDTLIDAPIATVWRLIADPEGWPDFDPAVRDVRVYGAVAPDEEFRRRIGRTKVRALFAVVEPEREITWVGAASGAKVVHRNLLSVVSEAKTRVVSEESMAGVLLPLFYGRAKLDRALDGWLAALKTACEQQARDEP